ncbi:MAG: glutamate-5-semialdehyde dehydrogenase [Rhodospirillaceae bacterium]|jgi:glutamate-5-semialdehyde dehydrogenase|nr:glutamate-5-semialdehyde dehydrogenase [Rhodospirillaceae bacterium]MBT5810756.1 glutamate-5-semialdehyde dehydrogenase [Rhodospirillaceae bacterium]
MTAAALEETDVAGAVPGDVPSGDVAGEVRRLALSAKEAGRVLARASGDARNTALREAAGVIRAREAELLAANAKDVAFGREKGLSAAMIDRLTLTPDRIEAMARGLEDVAALPDPIGTVLAEWDRPNGLKFQRVRVPLGVIGIIYESRPNVTADAGGLCLKSGNAAVLRGGSESVHSSGMIGDCLRQGLVAAGLPGDCLQIIRTRDRAAVGAMLQASGLIDIIVPRGGRSLIERVMADSRIPIIAHLEGICHIYVDRAADPDMAREITVNAKMRRTGICGAAETLLIDKTVAAAQLPGIVDALAEKGCELRGDAAAQGIDARIGAANEADWDTEYLDAIISVKVVDGVDDAVAHINRHGSEHTDSIVTDDLNAAETFLADVDSAIVMHNASTQFADGGEFGMGAEIGISTGKLHARGPVGAEKLTTYKYVVRGAGQVRP